MAPRDFEVDRNRLGALVLLQRGHDQSLGDLPYAEKRDDYGVARGGPARGLLMPEPQLVELCALLHDTGV